MIRFDWSGNTNNQKPVHNFLLMLETNDISLGSIGKKGKIVNIIRFDWSGQD